MRRITGVDVAPNLFGTGKNGFRSETPGVNEATEVTEQFLNDVQEELCNVVEAAGSALSSGRDQLLRSIQLMLARQAVSNHVGRTASGGNLQDVAVNPSGVVIAVGANIVQRSADGGVTWADVKPANLKTYPGACWFAAASMFVIALVGDAPGNCIWTSADGSTGTWTLRTAGSSTGLTSVAANSTMCIAVGDGIYRTTDGITWVACTVAGGYSGTFNGVCWHADAGLWIAVGQNGEIQTSPDGINWTKRTAPGGYVGTYGRVASNGTRAIASSAGTSAVHFTDDGVTWTAATPPAVGYVSWVRDAWVHLSDAIYMSLDGTSWKPAPHPLGFSGTLRAAIRAGNCITMFGTSSLIRQSTVIP